MNRKRSRINMQKYGIEIAFAYPVWLSVLGEGVFSFFLLVTTMLGLPMTIASSIMIYDTYQNRTFHVGDFHQVERFITYAANFIGQDYLKQRVEVHLYGKPEQLHSNLRNSFQNLCHSIHLHDEAV